MKIPDIKRYENEKEKWIKNGEPIRSKSRVQELFQICSSCENYKKFTTNSGQCQICTCLIKEKGKFFNKLAWATTRCPLEEPKWVEEPPYNDPNYQPVQIEKAAEVQIQPPVIKQSPNDCGCG